MIVRLYTGPDGESHFEEIEPALVQRGPAERSPIEAAGGIEFGRFQPGHFSDWHHAPRRQYVFSIAGQMEIGIGDGTIVTFGPGDVLLAEDLSGRGHTMRVVGSEPRVHAAVPLQE
jgi:quercetin dioxygenase-like cupin family protein